MRQLWYLHVISCSPGSPIGCGAPPTLATGVTGEYNGTAVSSVIIYQCQQSGFAPSAPSSVCGEDGRWSPDPSQVVCVELPGLLLRFPATTVELKQYCKTLTLNKCSVFTYWFYSDWPTNADWCYHFCSSVASSIDCGAPSLSCGVIVEPFSSTAVGSELVYQCQSGFLPEGRRTLLCGEDGRWNPDPQSLCTGTNTN